MEALYTYYSAFALFYPGEPSFVVYDRMMPGWAGRFYFQLPEQETRFLQLYSQAYALGRCRTSCLMECRRKDVTPITLDIDRKGPDRVEFTRLEVDELLHNLRQTLSKYFAFERLYGVVLWKTPYQRDDGQWSSGMHVQLDAWMTRTQVSRVVQVINFDGLDTQASLGTWFLLGSGKGEKRGGAYAIRWKFELTSEAVIWKGEPQGLDAADVYRYSIRRAGSDVQMMQLRKPLTPERPVVFPKRSDDTRHANMSMAELRRILCKVDVKHAQERTLWFRIMCSIHNETCGSEGGLGLFLEFSQRDPHKYNEGVCRREWLSYQTRLYPYAREYLYKVALGGARKEADPVDQLACTAIVGKVDPPYSCPYDSVGGKTCGELFSTHCKLHKHYRNHVWWAKTQGRVLEDILVDPTQAAKCVSCRSLR